MHRCHPASCDGVDTEQPDASVMNLIMRRVQQVGRDKEKKLVWMFGSRPWTSISHTHARTHLCCVALKLPFSKALF